MGAEVDHDMCAGVGQCMLEAPGAFGYDDNGFSVFHPSGSYTEAQLRRAVDVCPMSAISLTSV